MTTDTVSQEELSLNCEQTVRLLWDYLDRQLPSIDAEAVDRHLHDCKTHCASHFEFERAFLAVMRASRPHVVASDTLRLRVLSLIASERGQAGHG